MEMTWTDVAAIRRDYNQADSGHWFDSKTMRFFKSRLGSSVYGGCLFVSSEEGPSGGRRYTIRVATREANGTISIGDGCPFQYYARRREAARDAARLARHIRAEMHPDEVFARWIEEVAPRGDKAEVCKGRPVVHVVDLCSGRRRNATTLYGRPAEVTP